MKFSILLFLLLATSAYTQPVIHYMQVNEASGTLSIQGNFPLSKGNVFVDSVELTVISRSDTLLIATIPDAGRGSIGGVEIEADGKRTQSRFLTEWHLQSEWFGMQFIDSLGLSRDSTYINFDLYFRLDLHSVCKNRLFSKSPSFSSIPGRSTYFLKSIKALNGSQPYIDTTFNVPFGDADIRLNESRDYVEFSAYTYIYPYNKAVPFNYYFYPRIVEKYIVDSGYVNSSLFPPSNYRLQTWKRGIAKFEPPAKVLILAYQPILQIPHNNDPSIPIKKALFRWYDLKFSDSIPMMDNYRLQLSMDTNFANVILDTIVNSIEYTHSLLDYNTKYFWRVQGINNEGASEWSRIRHFITESLSTVSSNEKQGFSFYPNPCTNKIAVNLSSEMSQPLSYTIYNSLGLKLGESIAIPDLDRTQFTISLPYLPSGSYLLLFQNQKLAVTGNFIVLQK